MTPPDFGWAVGLALIFAAFIVIAIGAHIVDEDRRDLKRLRQLERARLSWQTRLIEEQAFFKQELP